jgi:hypothetical protein
MLRKSFLACALIASLLSPGFLSAAVKLTELADRVRVEIDGKVFTEYCFKDWKYPYLYPVNGPNGESVVRHYPMTPGVKGEQQDHPHHRAIFFTHSHVNDFNFWAPQAEERKGRATAIAHDRFEKIQSGEKRGELIVWTKWTGEGEVVLRERKRLTFIPAGKGQVLMDYDVTLYAGAKDVKFGDNKDGGLGLRVASTMKVKALARHAKESPSFGTIMNSRGDKNDAAWGKQAEWVDYSGPDASGKTVGVAMFDHPSNLRAPTGWHARYYGLLTANRFAAGSFGRASGAKKGDGDYTIRKGESLTLRHRFFIHHGDSDAAKVAESYEAYVGSGK